MRKLHHGHSFMAGAATAALVVSRRPELIFAAGVMAGLLLAGGLRLYRTLLGAFEAWRDHSRAKRRPVETRPVPRYPNDTVPF